LPNAEHVTFLEAGLKEGSDGCFSDPFASAEEDARKCKTTRERLERALMGEQLNSLPVVVQAKTEDVDRDEGRLMLPHPIIHGSTLVG
jgi:hypothetical protein